MWSLFIICRTYNHSTCRNTNHITDKIKKNSKCFTKSSTSLPVRYLLLVVDAWTVGGGGGGVLGDGGGELAAGSRPISWARGEMEGVRQKDGGDEVAWIRLKSGTLSLALEKKSFLNCGLIWLRGRAPPPPLQVKEADEFRVCWFALYSVAPRPATLLRSRLCGTLCLCAEAVRGDVFVHVKCLRVFCLQEIKRIRNAAGQMAAVCHNQPLLKAQSFTVTAANLIHPDKHKRRTSGKQFLTS